MSKYAAVATRALAQITKKGNTVTFTPAGTSSGGVYDPLTDTWSGGSAGVGVAGRAVQIEGDADRFVALNLVLVNPVTLLVAAKNLGIVPVPGMTMTWAGTDYAVVDVDPTAPDGVALLYTVTGNAA